MTNKLSKTVAKKKKRVGRGVGSGKGFHTVGRGTKGQKARSKISVLFEGVKVKKSLLRRLPLQRGKGKFKAALEPVILNLDDLSALDKKVTKLDLEVLAKSGLVNPREIKRRGVKILGQGELKRKLEVNLPTSASARKKIEKAGGKVSQ